MGAITTPTSQNFSMGELSPRLRGRYDIQPYHSGLERMVNFLPDVQGQASFVNGTEYVANTTGDSAGVLIPFSYKDEADYVLCFTNGIFQVFKDGAEVTGLTISGTKNWTTATLFTMSFAANQDTLFLVDSSWKPQKITRTSDTAWSVVDYAPTADPFTSSTNYPAAVGFYEQRIIFGGTDTDKQTLFFSKSADIEDMTVGTSADDGMEYTLFSYQAAPIEWIRGIQDMLVVGTASSPFSVTGGDSNQAITPSSISIRPMNGVGCDSANPVVDDGRIFYVQDGGVRTRAIESIDFGRANIIDRNIIADHITSGVISQMALEESVTNRIYCVLNDGDVAVNNVVSGEAVSGWARISLENSSVESVASIRRSGSNHRVWFIVSRVVDGSTERHVVFMSDDPVVPQKDDYFVDSDSLSTDFSDWSLAMFEAQKTYNHLDSASIYDGSDQSVSMTPAAITGSTIEFTAGGSVFSSGDVGREIWEKDGLGRAVITSYTDATHVDCDIAVDFASTATISAGSWWFTTDAMSNLSHLEGLEIGIIADGGSHDPKTVASGAITLSTQFSKIYAGIQYYGEIKTMNLEAQSSTGSGQTKDKAIYRVGIRFLNTLGASVGTNKYNMEDLDFRDVESYLNRPPQLFSMDKVVSVSDSHDSEKHVYVNQNRPLPCNIQLISPRVNTSSK